VQLFRGVSFFRSTFFAICGVALVSCSGANTLPTVSEDAPAVVGPAVSTTSAHQTNSGISTFAANPCANPKFPVVCVQQGQYGQLSIQETCGKTRAACGKVKWTTKTSNKGLTAYFQPNPGDPTTEIVDAFITMKVGKYSQTIKIDCSKNKNCIKYPLKATIYVTKAQGKE
jgi:hypothetical protein